MIRPAIIRLGRLGRLVESLNGGLGGLYQGDIYAFASNILKAFLMFAIGRFVENNSMLILGRRLRIVGVGLNSILRPFDLSVVKRMHRPF